MRKAITSKERALDVVAFVLALAIPILAVGLKAWGFLVDIVVIVPFVWLGVRHGKLPGVVVALLSVGGVYLISWDLFLTIGKGLLLLGVSLSFILGAEKGWKPGKMLFWASLAWLPFVFLSLAPLGQDWMTQLQEVYLDLFQQAGFAQVLMMGQGISASNAQDMLEMISEVAAVIYPSVIWVYGIITVVVNFLLIRVVLSRGLGLSFRIGPFTQWTLPWYAVWGAIAGIAAYLVGDNWGIRWMVELGINLGLVYALVCMVLGTSLTIFLVLSPKIPVLLKVVLVIISLVYPVIPALLGLFDLVFNFRKIPEYV